MLVVKVKLTADVVSFSLVFFLRTSQFRSQVLRNSKCHKELSNSIIITIIRSCQVLGIASGSLKTYSETITNCDNDHFLFYI